jgi:hypothetical protein
MAKVIERLPRKREALGSNPSTMLGTMADVYNPSYSGDRDQED